MTDRTTPAITPTAAPGDAGDTDRSTVALAPRLALRPKEAAKALGIGERKLWELTADQTSGIPHARFGKAVVYPVAELERWLAEQVKAGKRGGHG